MSSPTIPAVAATHITKVIGRKTILSDVSVVVDPGSRVGLVGPNGAGKTTLLKILSGLWRPTAGVVACGGERLSPHTCPRGVGVVLEDTRLYPYLTGRDHLRASARMHGVAPDAAVWRVADWLSLSPFLDTPVRRLSLGQRQRILLARALVPDRQVLLLDEPTNGLDPDGVQDLRLLLDRLSQGGMAVLISSHGLLDLARMVDRALFIRHGSVVADEVVEGPLDALDARWQILFPRGTG